jgi:hypothetical protein
MGCSSEVSIWLRFDSHDDDAALVIVVVFTVKVKYFCRWCLCFCPCRFLDCVRDYSSGTSGDGDRRERSDEDCSDPRAFVVVSLGGHFCASRGSSCDLRDLLGEVVANCHAATCVYFW